MVKSPKHFWVGTVAIFVGFLNLELDASLLGFTILILGVVNLYYGLEG